MRGPLQLLSGALFGSGLVLAGMTQTEKVRGFLDFFGSWDPSLAFVMGGAILVHAIAYRLIRGRAAPIFETKFHLPTRKDVDLPLVLGSALFGFGWGLGGYCPGPALTSLGTFGRDAMLFVGAMLLGMGLYRAWFALRIERATPSAGESAPIDSTEDDELLPSPELNA